MVDRHIELRGSQTGKLVTEVTDVADHIPTEFLSVLLRDRVRTAEGALAVSAEIVEPISIVVTEPIIEDPIG
jgi:hypothetical protein